MSLRRSASKSYLGFSLTSDAGRHTSVTIGTDGLGLISYLDVTNGDLKVAHCDDIVCSSASLATLDETGNVGLYTSAEAAARR